MKIRILIEKECPQCEGIRNEGDKICPYCYGVGWISSQITMGEFRKFIEPIIRSVLKEII